MGDDVRTVINSGTAGVAKKEQNVVEKYSVHNFHGTADPMVAPKEMLNVTNSQSQYPGLKFWVMFNFLLQMFPGEEVPTKERKSMLQKVIFNF